MDLFRVNRKIFQVMGLIALFILFYMFFLSPPSGFPVGEIVKIKQGSSLRGVSLVLKEGHVIRSRILFEAFIILFGKEKHVVGGNYYFEGRLPVFTIANRMAGGRHNLAPIAVTIPEGFDIEQIADLCSLKLENFNRDNFLTEAQGLEGYLFPDTYFFSMSDDEQSVISYMNKNFDKKISPLASSILNSGKTEEEIMVMASIIEREAQGDDDRNVISGILWKRLEKGIPLQVDAAPDTYKIKGLPEAPIGNPGIDAIKAAIFPQDSKYLYYLHDKNGDVHYARTFEEHKQNISKYLK